MAHEKVYKIHEVIAIASEWASNPDDMEAYNNLENLKADLVVREYMPIGMKELCLRKAMIDMRIDDDESISPYGFSVKYEIAMFFDCLLAYVVNIDRDVDAIFKDLDYYDLM